MPKKFLGLLTGVLLLIVPASAGAVGPATVRVQAEGVDATQIAPTFVTTNTNPVIKDGDPAHTCTGTSAAGALDLATGGNWGATWFDGGLGYSVGRLGTEDYSTSTYAYWSFAINEVAASTGVCGAELSTGDRLLFYKSCFAASDDGKPCTDDQILHIVAPSRSVPGTTTVKVEIVDAFTGARAAAPGVTVTSGSQTASTNGAGEASLSFASGTQTVRATAGVHVPDQTTICVAPNGNNGLCGAPDKSAPETTISIKDGKRYRKKGPRSLKGTVSDAAGLAKFQLRLTARPSTRSSKCTTFDAKRAKFVKQNKCGAKRGSAFTVDVKGSQWNYLLPKAPGKGRYVLDAIATDTSGNTTLERVVFFVK